MITKEQIESIRSHYTSVAKDFPWEEVSRHYLAIAEACDIALEALELRALVPTDEELNELELSLDGMCTGEADCHLDHAHKWLDRVRAWKGRAT
jgi:hypothetical protein